MPCFVLNTNISRDKIPGDFLPDLSALIAKLTGKPEALVMIQVNPDQVMSFGGSTEPCANCYLGNIGKLNNKDVTKAVMEKISESLKIPADRTFIFFTNLAAGDVGYNKTTF